jgi:peptidoglycan/LPS O-acetylase OafA/YrhL
MNRQFPALSGLAMLLIVLNHTIELGTKMPVSYGFPRVEGGMRVVLTLLQTLGVFAVPTFLFISGAFISYAARGEPPRLTAKFFVGSLAHIWWPYFLWSLLFYVVVFLQLGERYTLLGYGKNILVGYPFHFVPLLLLFYLLSPLLVRLGRHYAAFLIAAFGIYQLCLLTLLQTEALPQSMKVLRPPVVGRTFADWGVYFPLGLVYGLHMKAMVPRLQKLRWPLMVLTFAAFILRSLHVNGVVHLPLIADLAPLPFVMLLPAIDRRSIPLIGTLEEIGKRSYGLYLTHLLVLDLTLWVIGTAMPGLFHYQVALLPILFLVALQVPLLLMNSLARSPARAIYRFALG